MTTKKTFIDGDKLALDGAFERILRGQGLRDGLYPDIFSQLISAGESITTPLTLHVETTGDDTLGDGSTNRPYRTIQAAIDSVAYLDMKAVVAISVGIGTFDGFIIKNLRIASITNSFSIIGTMVATQISQGNTSGVVTAAAVGSVSRNFLTITDNLQNLATNALTGTMIAINGANYPIISNTATTITTCLNSAFNVTANVTTYTLVTPATKINPTSSQGTCVSVYNCLVDPGAASVTAGNIKISQMNFLGSGFITQIRVNFASITISSSVFGNGSASAFTVCNAGTNSYLSLSQCWLPIPTSGTIVFFSTSNFANFSANYCYFKGPGAGIDVEIVRTSGTGCYTAASACYIDSVRFPFFTYVVGISLSIFTCIFVNCYACIWINYPGFANINSCEFTSCSNLFVIGTSAVGASSVMAIAGTTGSGNTFGIQAYRGSRVRIDAASILGTTSDIVLDDAAAITLVTMRGNAPKLSSNAYGTIVFE